MEISPAKRVGTILRLLREESGQTQAQVAKACHISDSMVSHLESGTKGAHVDTVAKVGKAIRHEHVVNELWGFIGDPGTAATADLLAGYEAEATRVSVWNWSVFHALMQTESYARAVIRAALPFATSDEVDALAGKRMERQQALRRDGPPLLWAVIDESVLYRPYGGKGVMRDQLSYIEEQSGDPAFVLQVAPFSATGHPGLEGVLGVVEFSDKTPIWYSDAWSAGKLSDDRAEVPDYARYFDRIRASALSPADSMALIREVKESRYGE